MKPFFHAWVIPLLMPYVAWAQEPPPPVPAVPAPAEQPAAPATETKGGWQGSLMFTLDEQRKLREVLDAYAQLKSGGPELARPSLSGLPGQSPTIQSLVDLELGKLLKDKTAKFVTAPSFYLESVAYRTPKQWTIWLSGQRLSPQEPKKDDLEVKSVQGHKVSFLWTTPWLPIIAAEWKDRAKPVEGTPGLYRLENGVMINETDNSVAFTLGLNQTFVTRALQIVEGRVDGQNIDVMGLGANKALEVPGEPEPLSPPDAAIAPPPPGPDAGIEGIAKQKDGMKNRIKQAIGQE